MDDEHDDGQFCWNEEKNESNFLNHGIWFQDVQPLFFQLAAYFGSTRKEYGEIRTIAIGFIEDVRIISAHAAPPPEKLPDLASTRKVGGSTSTMKTSKMNSLVDVCSGINCYG